MSSQKIRFSEKPRNSHHYATCQRWCCCRSERKKRPPCPTTDQCRRGFVCKTNADCASAPALNERSVAIGRAAQGRSLSSRRAVSATAAAAAAWTFSRVFLRSGACPAAVHIIACDYLPSHDSSYLGAETCREFQLKRENFPALWWCKLGLFFLCHLRRGFA